MSISTTACNRTAMFVCAVVVMVTGAAASAQSSSLLYVQPPARSILDQPHATQPTIGSDSPYSAVVPNDIRRPTTITIEQTSLIAVAAKQPRKFKVNDLITIIVRQQKKYEGEEALDTEKKWNLTSKLSEWFRFHPGSKLGTDQLTNGQPGVKFDLNDKYETEGEREREDKFTTRITSEVIDVKPNGNPVLEATRTQEHDEDAFTVTITGTCRSAAVPADNTVLSTQLARLDVRDKSGGTLSNASKKGWIPKALDWLRPY